MKFQIFSLFVLAALFVSSGKFKKNGYKNLFLILIFAFGRLHRFYQKDIFVVTVDQKHLFYNLFKIPFNAND